jgi:hypothetical protein
VAKEISRRATGRLILRFAEEIPLKSRVSSLGLVTQCFEVVFLDSVRLVGESVAIPESRLRRGWPKRNSRMRRGTPPLCRALHRGLRRWETTCIFLLVPSWRSKWIDRFQFSLFCSRRAFRSPRKWLQYPEPGIPRTPDGKPNLSAPPPKTPDGKPDFSGVWAVANSELAPQDNPSHDRILPTATVCSSSG